MPSKDPQNHGLIWADLLEDLDSCASSWWQIIAFLYGKEHGYSNYIHCQRRGYESVRADVLSDQRIKVHLAIDEDNLQKVHAVLDEMCHKLNSQANPARKLKFAGVPFLKCITKVYSSIYVNNHLLPLNNGYKLGHDLFREQYLSISEKLPIVMLPTHRSYMDFLFISYIMTHYELPLPIVATGDNFKSLGSACTNYLKGTGAFLVRRDAQRKKDVDANFYYDILRAYVHSVLKGGENPLEFFMEGTRTRVGQVLRPKTGLLSMVVDTMLDNIVEDVYILPVAINYQRPIEEQLYIAENTPEINRKKPKESARNLLNAFDAVMKRQYGKVYVRFLQPFKLSEYFEEWKLVTDTTSVKDENKDSILHEFTNSLASKVCLLQANSNILMPFNLLTCSMLSKTFLQRSYAKDENKILKLPIAGIIEDFYLLENLLRATQTQFLPGWESHLEILDEFKLDRDNIIRSTDDRRQVEFNADALTFQTMLYYSNQVIQILLPVAICLVSKDESIQWEQYKQIRTLLSREFFTNELFMRQEFDAAFRALQGNIVTSETRQMIVNHLAYFIRSYLKFFNYLKEVELFDKNEFFQMKTGSGPNDNLYISKDMLKNMTCLVKDELICESVPGTEQLKVVDGSKLREIIGQYDEVLKMLV